MKIAVSFLPALLLLLSSVPLLAEAPKGVNNDREMERRKLQFRRYYGDEVHRILPSSRGKRNSKEGGSKGEGGAGKKKGSKKGDEVLCDPEMCHLAASPEDVEDMCPPGDPLVECEPPEEDEDNGKKGRRELPEEDEKGKQKSAKKGGMLPETGYACTCETLAPSPEPTSSPSAFPTLSKDEQNEIITCIAIIDEADTLSVTEFGALWAQFRTEYPDRPFCLLQPQRPIDTIDDLNIPEAFDTDSNKVFAVVNRDVGDPALASDYFAECNLAELQSQGFTNVAIFIDNSGSMTTSTVQASLDLLETNLAAVGITLVAGIENEDEDWVSPFLTDFI